MKIRKLMKVNYDGEDINDINEDIMDAINDGISDEECEYGIPTGVIQVTVEYVYEEEDEE